MCTLCIFLTILRYDKWGELLAVIGWHGANQIGHHLRTLGGLF